MLYFLYGTDTDKVLKKANDIILALQKRKTNSSLFKLTDDSWNQGELESLLQSQGLFEKNYIVFLDRVFKNKEAPAWILENLKNLKESSNIFLLVEGDLKAEEIKKIEKMAEKTQVFDLPLKKVLSKEEKLAAIGEKIDFFEYAEAFGIGDKKNLWLKYRQAVDLGVPAEEIHGIFFWQLKTMLLATMNKTPEAAGLKPYPFTKAKKYAEKYSKERLIKMGWAFVEMYHEAHLGKKDLSNELEKLVVGM